MRSSNNQIFIASDHAGFAMKKILSQHLVDLGVEVIDLGPQTEESVDYPDYAVKLARTMKPLPRAMGILVCGTGIGMSLAANKVRGIRCALCGDCYSAKMSRAHNNANMLALGARVIGAELAKLIVETWLDTPFEGGRHQRRVDMVMALEQDGGENV